MLRLNGSSQGEVGEGELVMRPSSQQSDATASEPIDFGSSLPRAVVSDAAARLTIRQRQLHDQIFGRLAEQDSEGLEGDQCEPSRANEDVAKYFRMFEASVDGDYPPADMDLDLNAYELYWSSDFWARTEFPQ